MYYILLTIRLGPHYLHFSKYCYISQRKMGLMKQILAHEKWSERVVAHKWVGFYQ